uniref:Photosystem II D1 processing protein PSB27-H2, chloroplastic n=1 Tax=Setaria italica TaxID=4555 RepID=K4AD85_SETIT
MARTCAGGERPSGGPSRVCWWPRRARDSRVRGSLDGCCSAGDKVPDYQKRLEVNQEQEVVARINNASPSAASDARAEQVLPLLLVAVAADTAEAAASCGDQEEANLAGGGAARLPITRRAHAASLLLGLVGVDVAVAAPAPARADDESGGGEEGVLGAIKSIFDPNEKTKAGKVLPKAYLKAAREVVRTLRESLEEDDGGDMAKFRRNADAAKESIREFLGGWRGQQAVAAEVRHAHPCLRIFQLCSVQCVAIFRDCSSAGVVRCVGEGDQITGGVLLQSRTFSTASTGCQEQDPR